MRDRDLAYLATSAGIIEQGMAGAAAILAEGSQCVVRDSRRNAQMAALNQALIARDRLDLLIARLGGAPRSIEACVDDLLTDDLDELRGLADDLSDASAKVERRIEELEGGAAADDLRSLRGWHRWAVL